MNFMKTIVGKVRRSSVHYLMAPVTPGHEDQHDRSDTWGSVAVVVLLIAVVGLVRMFLTA